MTDKIERLDNLMAEMLEIYKAKNKDYGDSFSESFEEFGLIAPVVRMNDKMNRIKSLSKKGDRQVKDESLRDSLMDLANYALMTVVELDQEVEKEEKARPDWMTRCLGEPIRDCERENKLENDFDSVLHRIESLDDNKKYYLKALLSGIDEEYCYLNINDRYSGFMLSNKDEAACYQTEFSKVDIRWLIRDWNINLDEFEIIEVESDYEAGRQENL